MKKIKIFICLSLIIVLGASFAFARGRYDRENELPGYVKTEPAVADGVMLSSPADIYAVTLYADTAGSNFAIYDSASAVTTSGDNTTPVKAKIEAGEATQYDTVRYEYDPPIQMKNGAYLDITTGGQVTIEYR